MVLSKQELIQALRNEVRILVHLCGKVDAAIADFRPTPKQRSVVELMRYLAIMAPIHLPAVLAPSFDLEGWKKDWGTLEARAAAMTLEEAIQAIAAQSDWLDATLSACPDDQFREEFEIFGVKATRGALLVSLVLTHYAAYRMQLFLTLKAAGHQELNTLNLWAGRDAV